MRPVVRELHVFSSRAPQRFTASPSPLLARNGARSGSPGLLCSIVRELHVYAEVALPQHGNDLLQRVTILGAYAHQIALNRRLNFLLAVLDFFDDIARLLDWNALLQAYLLAHRAACGRFNRAIVQAFQRHPALNQLALKDVVDRLQLVFIL